MLVLARKKGETIIYRVKLAFDAPLTVSIVRGELLDQQEQTDAEASQ